MNQVVTKTALINGQKHDWADVTIRLCGEPYKGVVSINWGPSKSGDNHLSYSGDFSLSLEASAKFEKAARNADKTTSNYAPFLLQIAYANKKSGLKEIVNIVLSDVEITCVETLTENAQPVGFRYSIVIATVTSF